MRQLNLKIILILLFAVLVSDAYAQKRVFWLDSYDPSNQWTAEMGSAIRSLLSEHNVDLKIHHMDTKHNKSEDYLKKAAQKAVDLIKEYHPDVVIASEDAVPAGLGDGQDRTGVDAPEQQRDRLHASEVLHAADGHQVPRVLVPLRPTAIQKDLPPTADLPQLGGRGPLR